MGRSTRRETVAPARWLRQAALITLALAAVACSSAVKPVQTTVKPDAAPKASPETGRIDVDCEPGEARVVVDEQPRGTANEITQRGGLELSRGHHRIEIKHDGYHPFRFELILGVKTETIKVRLRATGKRP